MILSANKLLKRLGISVKRKRNTRLKRTLDKELRARFEGKEYELVNLDPKTAKIHELLKMPNKQIIAHTNDVGEITAIQEMRALRNDRK